MNNHVHVGENGHHIPIALLLAVKVLKVDQGFVKEEIIAKVLR